MALDKDNLQILVNRLRNAIAIDKWLQAMPDELSSRAADAVHESLYYDCILEPFYEAYDFLNPGKRTDDEDPADAEDIYNDIPAHFERMAQEIEAKINEFEDATQ